MPDGSGKEADFFLSRRGSVAAIAREVADVLTEEGYKVVVQDYDIPLGASFIEAMHEAIKNSRGLIILFTDDYEKSPHTRKEFTSFEADRHHGTDRFIVVLRCEDVPLRGLLADSVYQDLVGVSDPIERRRRIIAAAERRSSAQRPQRRGRTFVGVPPRIAGFTGRADAFDRLDAILTNDKPAAVTQVGRAAVQGMGGIGKTSLAVEYAHRFRNLYDGVWWCPAQTRAGLLTSLAALAVELEVAAPAEEIETAAKAALRRLSEGRDIWLLVYDNVAAPKEIADLLPAGGARVLITSRFSGWRGWAEQVELDALPLEEATELLQARAGRSDPAGAQTLAEMLGRLPLALDHAAAYCWRTQMSFGAYAAKVERLIATQVDNVAYPTTVAATFDLAIANAIAHCPDAEILMAYLGHCAPERIPMSLVEGAIDDEEVCREALAVLHDVSLVKHDPFEDGGPALTVHRLVQAVARVQADTKDMTRSAVTGLLARLATLYPADGYDNPASWPLCAALTPHLLARCETEKSDAALAQCAGLLSAAGSYFHGRAAYSSARPLFERALAIDQKNHGSDDPSVARDLNSLALLLKDTNRLAEAEPLFRRALAIDEKSHGPDDPAVARDLNNLAEVLGGTSRFADALPLFQRALAIAEKSYGPDHPDVAKNLINFNYSKKKRAEAESLFRRALAIAEKSDGPDHPIVATCLVNLGDLLFATGRPGKAEPLFRRALAIEEKSYGPDHSTVAFYLNNLALSLNRTNQLAEAESLLRRALAIAEKSYGPDHPTVAIYLNNLALLLRHNNRIAEAEPLFRRALMIDENSYGPDHFAVARDLNYVADLLQATDRLAEAEPLLRRALMIDENSYGADHFTVARDLKYLAALLRATPRSADAEPLQLRARAIMVGFARRILPMHPLLKWLVPILAPRVADIALKQLSVSAFCYERQPVPRRGKPKSKMCESGEC